MEYGKLFHKWTESNEEFFKRIDECGGWPLKAKSVVLRHGDKRDCYFSEKEEIRDEWNTSIATSDEYFVWKLSEKAKDEFRREGRRQAYDAICRLGVFKS